MSSTPSFKLFVGQVPRSFTEHELHQLFRKYGPLQEVALVRDRKTGASRGCAFVRFSERESADAAIADLHNRLVLHNARHPLQIRYANGPERDQVAISSRPRYEPTPETAKTKLFCGMLGRNITEIQLHMMFSQFGDIDEIVLLRDATGRSRRCAFVRLKSREAAEKAVASLHERVHFDDAPAPCVCKFAAEEEQGELIRTEFLEGEGDSSYEEGPSGANLVIYGLGPKFSVSKLLGLFSEFGTVINSTLYKSKSSQGEIYYARLAFNTAEAAVEATEALNGQEIDGCLLTVIRKKIEVP
ncbi:hypothetical protein P9112_011171 [Eukaryota sp. TZLM1-RC]